MSSPFRVDSDEGREIVVDVVPALLETDEPFGLTLGGELPTFRLRMTNAEAADLLALLEGEIGEWARERASARRAFEEGEGRADFDLWPGEAELLDPLDPRSEGYADALRDLGDVSRKASREHG